MKKIIVHNDRFHADDVFSVATLKILFNNDIEIIRTRDQDIIESGDIVLDVGNVYDPNRNRFDHHQAEGAGERENGIPYASFGLIWKHFGIDLCDNQKVWESFDKRLVQPIDATDNGYILCESKTEILEYNLNAMIASFNPTWTESESLYNINFFVAVDIAKTIIERELKKANDSVLGNNLAKEEYEKMEDKRLLIINETYPWGDLAEENKELLFVISPSKLGDKWRINTVQEELFVNRKPLPEDWAGKRDEELQKISGVKDAIFCHRKRFVAYTKSKEGAIQMSKIALEQ